MEEEQKVVTITPIKRLKRVLVHLADLFLAFIFSFTLVNTAIIPIGNKIVKLENKINNATEIQHKRMDILFDNNLLSSNYEVTKYEFDKSFSYTFDLYLKGYVLGEESGEVFYTYFVSNKGDINQYIDSYVKADKDYGFLYISDDKVTMKEDYKKLFSPYFEEANKLSEFGEEKLEVFKNKIFTNLYNFMLDDILNNDLSSQGNSYVLLTNELNDITKWIQYYYSTCTLIGFVLVTALYFVLIPCFFANRRTLGMVLLRVQPISKNGLDLQRKRVIAINSLLAIPSSISLILLVPSISIGFSEIFSLPILTPLTLIGLLFDLVSLFFVLFSEYSQTISDLLSSTVIINNDDYDAIVYERNVKK